MYVSPIAPRSCCSSACSLANTRNVRSTRSKPDKFEDGFLHYHSVSIFNSNMASFLLSFWSPPTPTTCVTSPKSFLTSTVSDQAGDNQFAQRNVETNYSQDLSRSNQRTRNQFRPRNAGKGTTSYQLRQFAEATLGGGSLRKIVKLPEGEDENEWLAVNSEFFLITYISLCADIRVSGRFLQPH